MLNIFCKLMIVEKIKNIINLIDEAIKVDAEANIM
jgi:hypothetical protein